jgi:hypothetical protein
LWPGRFFTEVVPFERLRPVAGLAYGNDSRRGYQPLAMATAERDLIVVYGPAGGEITVVLDLEGYSGQWSDPRSGKIVDGGTRSGMMFTPPEQPQGEHPNDWVLVLRHG